MARITDAVWNCDPATRGMVKVHSEWVNTELKTYLRMTLSSKNFSFLCGCPKFLIEINCYFNCSMRRRIQWLGFTKEAIQNFLSKHIFFSISEISKEETSLVFFFCTETKTFSMQLLRQCNTGIFYMVFQNF